VTVGSTTNRPFQADGDVARVGFPTITFGGGYIQVAWLLDGSTIGLKRSLRSGRTWTVNPQILAAHADSASAPQLAARGDDIMLAFVRETSGGRQAMTRLSTTSGSGWRAPIALTAHVDPDSFAPTIAFRSQRWRIAFSRCTDEACTSSRVYYAESATGNHWGDRDPVSMAGHGPHAVSGGVTATGRILVAYAAGDPGGGSLDIFVRRTAA
jgi:hypothetical protein